MLKKIFGLFCAIILINCSSAAAEDNILQTENTKIQLFRNTQNDILAKFTINPDWHIYWQNPGEIGKPTIISSSESPLEVTNLSVPQIHTAYEIMQEYIYKDTAYFAIKLYNKEAGEISFDFVECSDVCKPEKITFATKDLTVSNHNDWQKIKKESEKTFPKKIKLISPTQRNELNFPLSSDDNITFIPAHHNVIDNASIIIERDNNQAKIKWLDIDEKKLTQALIITKNQAYLVDIEYKSESLLHLLYVVLLAFIGGIILNAMPCVFPILSLKIFALIKQRNRKKPWKEALGYTLGVLFSFLLLTACIIYLKNQGEAIGWGFQLQSPWFVGTMMIVFFLLFLAMMEWLHFPSMKRQIIYKLYQLNAFSTGFFAVLVASPCTGPFMGAAIGYAFMGSNAQIYAVFTALALGYALPYALIELFPQKIKKIMPKPGKWMSKVKVILAIPLLLTSIWLACILYKQLTITAGETSHKLQWRPYDGEEISLLNKQKENILIDFTADWCLTCKFNEKLFLNGETFQHFVEENNVHLFVADLTEDNEEYLQALSNYGRSSIPTYIYYSDGNYTILPLFFNVDKLIDK